MKTYHEKTGELIENPNLEEGFTYPGQRYIGTERIVLEGTVALYPPSGLGYDKPVYEDCLFFHPWEPGEKPGEKPGTEPDPPDNAPTWEEMADAYTEGVKMA